MVNKANIVFFFKMLNDSRINYVLLKNDENRVPDSVNDGDDIDILVHPADYEKYKGLLSKNGFKILPGESKKYYFLYKLRDDIFANKEDLYVHAYEKLSCVSFTNMGESKIPLNKTIQEYVWNHKHWNNDHDFWIMDNSSILLYLIVRSVFDKKCFRKRYIHEIELRCNILDDNDFHKRLELVFFKFTPKLIDLLKRGEYNTILLQYKCFHEY